MTSACGVTQKTTITGFGIVLCVVRLQFSVKNAQVLAQSSVPRDQECPGDQKYHEEQNTMLSRSSGFIYSVTFMTVAWVSSRCKAFRVKKATSVLSACWRVYDSILYKIPAAFNNIRRVVYKQEVAVVTTHWFLKSCHPAMHIFTADTHGGNASYITARVGNRTVKGCRELQLQKNQGCSFWLLPTGILRGKGFSLRRDCELLHLWLNQQSR